MGRPDYGKPDRGGKHSHTSAIPIDRLAGPAGAPQRTITLTAATGRQVIGGIAQPVLTFNGTTPGPTLVLRQGELVEVRLVNENVAQGVTIHWHGVDVPGREDGVAGVTQNAVLPGEQYVYRFVVPDAGTYWYHTHQDSVRSVARGLLGALVVLPASATSEGAPGPADVTALVHTYGPVTTINGAAGSTAIALPDGAAARVRLINSDNGPRLVTASVPFRVVAIDGTDVEGGHELTDTFVELPAGGRADLLVPVGAVGSRVGVLGGPSLVLGPDGADPPLLRAGVRFDALAYGTPGGAQLARAGLGPVSVKFDYRVGRRLGFLDGRFGDWYTINGRTIPDVPMFMVRSGDVVLMRVSNRTSQVHPMHLHGHHALVVARNGVPATGAPWWVDSLEVDPAESYDLVLVADNPGVWMFHCHNLPHARAGLMTHLMYEGVSTPYRIGRVSRQLVNQPE
jgi:FtsP/CotA-like multicopper oxidase with cupredoxin domain